LRCTFLRAFLLPSVFGWPSVPRDRSPTPTHGNDNGKGNVPSSTLSACRRRGRRAYRRKPITTGSFRSGSSGTAFGYPTITGATICRTAASPSSPRRAGSRRWPPAPPSRSRGPRHSRKHQVRRRQRTVHLQAAHLASPEM
jgi:hypothetical protein